MKHLKIIVAAFLLLLPLMASAGNEAVYFDVETYPQTISKSCREGIAQIYDECDSQQNLLDSAIQNAQETGKTVLVVYGAEWCIWCHVFDKYVKGYSQEFQYTWEYRKGDNQRWKMTERENKNAKDEAKALNQLVAESFVLLHIESHYSPDGAETAKSTGFDPGRFGYVPVIFTLDQAGKYASHMPEYDAIPGLEVREDSGRQFRGFNRKLLQTELDRLLSEARQ